MSTRSKQRNKEEEKTRSPVSDPQKKFMLAVLVRKREAFDRAKSLLQPSFFSESDIALATMWAICIEFVEEHNAMPARQYMCTEFEARSESDASSFTDLDFEEANDFIDVAFNMERDEMRTPVALRYLQWFLEDCMLEEVREEFSSSQAPADLRKKFEELQGRISSVSSIVAKPLDQPFPKGWDSVDAAIITRTTGVPFLNNFMDGGEAAGETYGLLGPYGGGKTTLGVQLTVAGALRAYKEWKSNGKTGPYSVAYLAHYEEPAKSLRIRALSYLAEIPRRTINDAIKEQNYNIFSRRDNLKAYERRKYAESMSRGGLVMAEYDRFRFAQKVLNKCWRLIDMTGVSKSRPSSGNRLVDEIADDIYSDQEAMKFSGEDVMVRSRTAPRLSGP